MKIITAFLLYLLVNNSYCATFEDGENAYKKGNYSKAMSIWLPLAEQGDAKAQNYIGVIYANGNGISQNLELATKWYQLAAAQGNVNAQSNMGNLYAYRLNTKKYEEAVKWWQLAADKGNKSSQINLGWYYMNGFENLPTNLIDYQAAKYWNEQGAKNGDAEGYNNLGWLYENGLGVVRNYTKAAELYQKAVTEGIRTGAKQNNIDEARSRLENVEAKLAKMKYTKKIKSNSSMQINNDPLNIRN